MDHSPESLPALAVASTSDGVQQAPRSECDDINQAWFTTKEDKDNLQGKGQCMLAALPLEKIN